MTQSIERSRTVQVTDQQQAFVNHFTNTPGAIGNASAAAKLAGYSPNCLGEIGRQLLEKPHVRKAIDAANRRLISGTLATKAVHLLERVIDDEAAPLKVRVEAAKTVLDRAGIVPLSVTERERAGNQDKKPLSEMTIEELDIFIRASQVVISKRRSDRLIEAQPGDDGVHGAK